MPFAPEYLHLVIPGVRFEAYLYGRNSDNVFAGHTDARDSVDDQLATGRDLCKRYDWRILREFKDSDLSASRHAKKTRGDFEDLIATITNDPAPAGVVRVVVAYEASRYYRDLEAYLRLRNACMTANVLLCYNDRVYDLSRRDDRKETAQHAIEAEDQADEIQLRNLRTTAQQAQAGMPHGKTQYGYTREYKTVNGRRRCIGQSEDARGIYVLQSLQRVDSGASIKSLVRWLRAEPKAARPDGKPWDEQTVRRMLLNRAYIGERLHQGTYAKAVWEPIKGLETPQGRAMFNRVTAKLSDPARRTARGQEVAHLLSYLGLCGECGDHALLRSNPRGSGRRPTLDCDEKHDTSIGEALINAYVEEALMSWFRDKKTARSALVPNDTQIETRTAAIQRLINAYEEQLAEAKTLSKTFDDKTGRFKLSAASLASMEQDLVPKLEEARKQLRELTGVSPLLLRMLDAADPDAEWYGRPGTDTEPEALGLTLEQKREVIRRVVTVRLFRASSPGVRRIEEGRIRLAFAGEPGFRARPLRVPGSAAAHADVAAAAQGTA